LRGEEWGRKKRVSVGRSNLKKQKLRGGKGKKKKEIRKKEKRTGPWRPIVHTSQAQSQFTQQGGKAPEFRAKRKEKDPPKGGRVFSRKKTP